MQGREEADSRGLEGREVFRAEEEEQPCRQEVERPTKGNFFKTLYLLPLEGQGVSADEAKEEKNCFVFRRLLSSHGSGKMQFHE